MGWSCSSCTYRNLNNASKSCLICSHPRVFPDKAKASCSTDDGNGGETTDTTTNNKGDDNDGEAITASKKRTDNGGEITISNNDNNKNKRCDNVGAVTANYNKKIKSEDNGKVPVTVEFKFRNLKTFVADEGGMVGTLHVPMLQDPETGRLEIPPGTTQVKGSAKIDQSKVRMSNADRPENPDDPVKFTAVFERPDANSAIENLKLGYHLQFYHDENVHTGLIRSTVPMNRGPDGVVQKDYYEFQSYSSKPTERKSCQRRLNDWEQNCGGTLTFYAKAGIDAEPVYTEGMKDAKKFVLNTTWKADYKIKLYTVISAHSPYEGGDTTTIKVEDGANTKADWWKLEELMLARFPDTGPYWARQAVQNYKYFLDIKIKHEDWNSETFSPSKAIDEVWHAHLSFPDRYRRDMMAYCGHIIEHSPVLGEQARDQYEAAYEVHMERMKEMADNDEKYYACGVIKEDFYDHEFWPKPQKVNEQFREDHDGDSEDCCKFPPENSSCG